MRPIYSSRSSCHDSEHTEIDSAFCNECTTMQISGSLNTDCRQCVCVCVWVREKERVCVGVCARECMCMHVYIHIHIYIHIYIYIYIHICKSKYWNPHTLFSSGHRTSGYYRGRQTKACTTLTTAAAAAAAAAAACSFCEHVKKSEGEGGRGGKREGGRQGQSA